MQACQEERQFKQFPASISEKRDPLQHMHFNSLFNGLGSHDDEERVYNDAAKHCTSAQKLQRMPATSSEAAVTVTMNQCKSVCFACNPVEFETV